MFVVCDLELRAIRTYPDGGMMLHANQELATNYAVACQGATEHPHCLQDSADKRLAQLQRVVCPFRNKAPTLE